MNTLPINVVTKKDMLTAAVFSCQSTYQTNFKKILLLFTKFIADEYALNLVRAKSYCFIEFLYSFDN